MRVLATTMIHGQISLENTALENYMCMDNECWNCAMNVTVRGFMHKSSAATQDRKTGTSSTWHLQVDNALAKHTCVSVLIMHWRSTLVRADNALAKHSRHEEQRQGLCYPEQIYIQPELYFSSRPNPCGVNLVNNPSSAVSSCKRRVWSSQMQDESLFLQKH